jgi:glutathione peroxidase
MRVLTYLLLLVLLVTIASFTNNKIKKIYAFKVESIEGGSINFSKFKGKKILIVNTASECQYTYQYAELQSLYTTYQDKLVIVGFPCNQFGHQEMGSNDEINSFCKARYGVTFPLATKVDVKGENAAPIYKWLCNKSENGVMDVQIKWNFNKFLIDEKGRLLAHFASNIKADSEDILKYLK